jgi:hypothetical protein
MSSDKSNDEDIQTLTDAYYEERACQEEIYLEETEEELRVILASGDRSSLRSESLNERREYAAEELIIGDSDDPPLREEVVEEMLKSMLGSLGLLSLRKRIRLYRRRQFTAAFFKEWYQDVPSGRR